MKGNKNTKTRAIEVIVAIIVVWMLVVGISIVIPVIFGVVLLVGSVKILERKYSLC